MTTPGSHGPGEQAPSGSGWGPPAGSSQPGSVPAPPPGQYSAPQGQQLPQGQQFPQGQYPPPQGQQLPQGQQFPQGQYPPPQGQQLPQGQYPPAQGQQFPQGQGWAPQQGPAKSGAGKWVAIAGAIIGVLIIAVFAIAFLVGNDPEVGDCLREDDQELSVVDCEDSAAEWKLLGTQEGDQSYDEYLADPETCADFPETVQSYWIGENGDESGQGVVYCLTTP